MQVQLVHVRPKRLQEVQRLGRLPELLGPNHLLRGLVSRVRVMVGSDRGSIPPFVVACAQPLSALPPPLLQLQRMDPNPNPNPNPNQVQRIYVQLALLRGLLRLRGVHLRGHLDGRDLHRPHGHANRLHQLQRRRGWELVQRRQAAVRGLGHRRRRPLLLRGRHRAADGGGGSVSGGPERHGRGRHACGLMLPSMRARRVRRIPVGYPWAHTHTPFPTSQPPCTVFVIVLSALLQLQFSHWRFVCPVSDSVGAFMCLLLPIAGYRGPIKNKTKNVTQ